MPLVRAIFRLCFATSILLAIATGFVAHGQTTVQWTGGSSTAWATTGNWSPGNVPNSNTEIATFSSNWTNTSRQPTIGSTSYTLGGIVVKSTAPTALTLAGTGTLTINTSGWSGTVGIDNQSTGNETINAKLAISNSQTWQTSNASGGSWTFGNTIALGSNTLTLSTNNAASTITASKVISGAGNLVVSGSGTVVVSSANTYTGTTTINNGATLRYSGTGGLSASTAVTVNSGGTYDLNGSSDTVASIAGAGDITLGSATLTAGGTDTTTFSGVISGATGSLIKSGNGSLSLTGANTYGGTTTLSVGTLDAGNDSAFSSGKLSVNGGTLTSSGGTRTLANTVAIGGNTTIGGANNLTFSGAVSQSGTARTLSITNTGTTTFSNTFTLAANNQTASVTIDVAGTSGGAFISGVIQNGTGSGADSLIKAGAGNLILSGANTYTGTTTITGGTLALSGSGVVPGNLVLNGGVLATHGTFSRTLGTSSTQFQFGAAGGGFAAYGGALSVSVGSNPVWGSTTSFLPTGGSLILGSSLADNVVDWTSNFSLGTAARTITVNDNANSANDYAKISGVISGTGGLIKNGGGLLVLSNANTFTGSTTVSDGTLSLQNATALGSGSAGTTVNSGGTLELNGVSMTNNGTLTLNGAGDNGSGALRSVNGANTYTGNITLGSAATIASGTAGNLFTVGTWTTNTVTMGSNTLTVDGAGDIKFKANLGASGTTSGGFIKNGTGTTTFNGDANYYTGTTTVNQGTLVLDTENNTIPDNAILGALVIGNGTGAADSVKVMYGSGAASNKIANGSQVTIYSDGELDMNGSRSGNSDTIGALVLYGGHVETGSGGLLTLTGDVTTYTNTANQTATINGHIDLNGATRTFTVNNGGLTSDLTVNATINSGSFIKDGTGTMTVTNGNSYTGTTEVKNGILNIQNSDALGSHGASLVTAGTTVDDGAALQLQSATGLTIGDEALSLKGSGYNNADGALRSVSGTNSLSGTVTLAGDARINADSGSSLTMTGDFTGTTQTLTVGGSGDTALSGAIGTGTGAIIKDGSGSLTLSGIATNSFSGGLNVQDGTVYLNKTSGLNATGTGALTVGNGLGSANSAVVQLYQNEQIANSAAVTINGDGKLDLNNHTETIGSLSGTGAGTLALGSGALTISDSNSTSYSGAITGTSDALVTKQGTGTLTLSGDISFGGNVTLANVAPNQTNTLEFTGNIPSIAGELKLGAGSVLALNLTGATHTLTVGTLHITGNTTIDFGGNSNSILNVTNLIIDSGVTLVSIINWTNASDFFFAQSWSGATLNTVGAGNPEIQITFSGYSPNQTAWLGNNPWTGYNQITPAPEPATYGFILMAAGLALVGYRRLRAGKKTAV